MFKVKALRTPGSYILRYDSQNEVPGAHWLGVTLLPLASAARMPEAIALQSGSRAATGLAVGKAEAESSEQARSEGNNMAKIWRAGQRALFNVLP